MSRYISKYAKCPFYRRNEDFRICCEGTDSNNTINIVFGSKKQLLEYEKCYCDSIEYCKYCLIHHALDKKWEDGCEEKE